MLGSTQVYQILIPLHISNIYDIGWRLIEKARDHPPLPVHIYPNPIEVRSNIHVQAPFDIGQLDMCWAPIRLWVGSTQHRARTREHTHKRNLLLVDSCKF
jgi:hypothetical protein